MNYGLSEYETIPVHLGGYGLVRTQVIAVLKGSPRCKISGGPRTCRKRVQGLGRMTISETNTAIKTEIESKAEESNLKPDIRPLVPTARRL